MANSESKSTTDHSEIQEWAEKRDGKPAIVEGTDKNGGGLLRINFPGYAEDNLKEISWDEFFEIFDENNLQFLYQEKTKDGEESRFSKFVSREK
jgi:anaerobic selenocysteine-containing dehydrogenase